MWGVGLETTGIMRQKQAAWFPTQVNLHFLLCR